MTKLTSPLVFISLLFSAHASPVPNPRLSYATYLSTGPNSLLRGLAVDASGNAYVAGVGPGVKGDCVFLSKLGPSGKDLAWLTCLSLSEIGAAAIDSSGFLVVIGRTSPPSPAPVVVRMSSDGGLLNMTTIQGAFSITKLVLDSSGNAYVSGQTASAFQPTAGAYSAASSRSFVAKLDPNGNLVYTASLDMSVGGIATDSHGRVWIAGSTCPADKGCPARRGASAAIQELDAAGKNLLASMAFEGGAGTNATLANFATAIAAAPDASLWVAGYDQAGSVPNSQNAIAVQGAGPFPGFVSRFHLRAYSNMAVISASP